MTPETHRLTHCLSALAIACLAASAAAASPTPAWVAAGPLAGDVVALAAAPGSPGTVYAASAFGFVLRSIDGAATWTRGGRVAPGVDAGLPGFNRITQLAVDPSDAAMVYAVSSVGLFRSTDAGATWAALAGAGTDFLEAVAIAPSNPATVYALTFNSLLRSRDHGATWRAVGRRKLPSFLSGLAVDPADAGKVYVGSSHGLWRSTDGGAHWAAATGPAAPGGLVAQVLVLANSSVLVLADFPSGGVVLSADGGVTWRAAYGGLPSIPGQPLSPTAVVRSGGGNFYVYYPDIGDVYRSNHLLRRWRRVSPLTPFFPPGIAFPVLSMAADSGADVIYGGVAGMGVLRSGRGGSGWTPANDGLALQEVRQVLAAPAGGGSGPMAVILTRPDIAPAFASEQIFVSPGATPPGASSWTEIPGVDVITNRIAFDPLTRTVYAASDFGLTRSTAGGPWTAAGAGLGASALIDLGVVAGAAGHLFGLSASPGTCGAAPCHTLSVFATTDGGASWHEQGSTSDADDPAEAPGPVRGQLALDPADPATLYILASGLHKSTDGGATWQTLPLPAFAAALVIDPSTPATLYAAVRPGAAEPIYKSLDGGGTWAPAAQGLAGGAPIASLAIDPSRPATLYLAGDGGVFTTADGAATWTALNQGLEGVSVLGLAVFAGAAGPGGPGGTVCAGTEGAGVFVFQPAP